MKKLIKLECPSCKSTLSTEAKREYMFCEYCGVKIILDNDNEHIIRNIDEADIKRAETEQLVKLKELELEEQKIADEKKKFQIMLYITAILGAIGLLSWIIGAAADNEDIQLIGFTVLPIIGWMWILRAASKEGKK